MATATGGTVSTALSLAPTNLTGIKSREACETMEETSRILSQLDMISSMFCHFEAESAQLKFGVKYNIDMGGGGGEGGAPPPGGPGGMLVDATKAQLWIDNSQSDYLHVYMCQSGKLSQHIKVSTGSVAGQAKGAMSAAFDNGGMSGGINLEFDLSTAGEKAVKASMGMTMTGAMSGSFNNFANILLKDSGVSVIKMSKSGTFNSQTHSDRSMLLFNGTMGQVVFKSTDHSTLSTYGADGNTVDDSTATADITVATDDIPPTLASDFAPVAPAGWDCVADTELVIDKSTGSAHSACESRKGPSFSNCDGAGFGRGQPKDVPHREPSNAPDGMAPPVEKAP